MKHSLGYVLMLGLGAGCASSGASPSGSDAGTGDIAVRWSVSQGLWGTEVFEVRRGGAGHYSFEPAGGGSDAKAFDVTVTQAQLDDIAETARRTDFCDEKSSRLGIPDEGRPTLQLDLSGVRCSVTMWDGEWSERKGAKEVAAKVLALHKAP